MSGAISQILSLMGVTSMICLLIAVILLLHLIQQAFNRSVVWGVISVFYPPGTYLYCRKNWDTMRSRFMLISALVIVSLVFWIILRVL